MNVHSLDILLVTLAVLTTGTLLVTVLYRAATVWTGLAERWKVFVALVGGGLVLHFLAVTATLALDTWRTGTFMVAITGYDHLFVEPEAQKYSRAANAQQQKLGEFARRWQLRWTKSRRYQDVFQILDPSLPGEWGSDVALVSPYAYVFLRMHDPGTYRYPVLGHKIVVPVEVDVPKDLNRGFCSASEIPTEFAGRDKYRSFALFDSEYCGPGATGERQSRSKSLKKGTRGRSKELDGADHLPLQDLAGEIGDDRRIVYILGQADSMSGNRLPRAFIDAVRRPIDIVLGSFDSREEINELSRRWKAGECAVGFFTDQQLLQFCNGMGSGDNKEHFAQRYPKLRVEALPEPIPLDAVVGNWCGRTEEIGDFAAGGCRGGAPRSREAMEYLSLIKYAQAYCPVTGGAGGKPGLPGCEDVYLTRACGIEPRKEDEEILARDAWLQRNYEFLEFIRSGVVLNAETADLLKPGCKVFDRQEDRGNWVLSRIPVDGGELPGLQELARRKIEPGGQYRGVLVAKWLNGSGDVYDFHCAGEPRKANAVEYCGDGLIVLKIQEMTGRGEELQRQLQGWRVLAPR